MDREQLRQGGEEDDWSSLPAYGTPRTDAQLELGGKEIWKTYASDELKAAFEMDDDGNTSVGQGDEAARKAEFVKWKAQQTTSPLAYLLEQTDAEIDAGRRRQLLTRVALPAAPGRPLGA